ncbi:MAG: cyclic nucleotide-binding domain-containing protein [Ignavibacteria bacterium]|nr:cyclic nucleotide-binding domain-containing protein [Ignavibacteria bacterium]
MMYYTGNKLIEKKGGAMRHIAMVNKFLLDKKREESKEILETLSQVDIIRALPPEEMHEILACVELQSFQKNETIFSAGDVGDALYLIRDGTIRIQNNGNVLADLQSGQTFGEMALLSGEVRMASAIALSGSTLMKISKEKFDELMQESPALRNAVEELNAQRLMTNVIAAGKNISDDKWEKIAVDQIHLLTAAERRNLLREHGKGGSKPFAIFLGALMDGIPESIVIGASFVSMATFQFTFLAAVFVANLPEAIGSAIAMKEAGLSHKKILTLWSSLVLCGAIAAVLGNYYLTDANPLLITITEAIAGGGILALVASVMMPEAYEHGGTSVGLATILGFLSAFFFSFI